MARSKKPSLTTLGTSRRGAQPSKVPQSTSNAVIAGGLASPYVNMLVDPFDAPPARVPDSHNGLSVALRLRRVITVTTDQWGDFCVEITAGASPNKSHVISGTGTPDTETTTYFDGTIQPAPYDLTDDFIKFRPTAIGIKVMYIGAEETKSGLLGSFYTVGLMADEFGTDLPKNTLLAHCDHTWTTKDYYTRLVPYNATRFNATDNTSVAADSWEHLVLVGQGLPASTEVIRIEISDNIEAIPKFSSLHRESAETEPHDPNVVAIASHVSTGKHYSSHRSLRVDGARLVENGAKFLAYSSPMWGSYAPAVGTTAEIMSTLMRLYQEMREKLRKKRAN